MKFDEAYLLWPHCYLQKRVNLINLKAIFSKKIRKYSLQTLKIIILCAMIQSHKDLFWYKNLAFCRPFGYKQPKYIQPWYRQFGYIQS